MPNLTRQEKWIIIFLAALILVGLGANFIRKTIPGVRPKMTFGPIGRGDRLLLAEKQVNINTAGFRELIKLKGIGVKTAERIIDYRESSGPFFYIEDIQNVKGIGPKKFNAIKECITTE